MKFVVVKTKENNMTMMRRLGYHPHRRDASFVRRLTLGAFPRLHIYLQDRSDSWEFSLHLDQKGASYPGTRAHSGDYDGEVLLAEKERIINFLNK